MQRICKYPLLLEQLLKKTDVDAPFYQELVDGLQVIRRITDKVNETRRVQENIQLVRDLESRVEDWKGHNIQTFGSLLLSDLFMVSKNDTEREYHVYLFEKILLCCKEVLPNQPKKNSKSNSLLKQKSQHGAPTPPGKKPKTTLQLKGRIFINNVTGAHSKSKATVLTTGGSSVLHVLQVYWRGDIDQESFSLRCKNEEQLKQWQTAIGKLIDEVSLRRQHIAAHYSQTGGISPGMFNMAGAGANGRRSTGGSLAQQSMFPQTPLTDIAPGYPFGRTDSQASQRAMEDDHVEGMRDGMDSGVSSGRGTPMGGRYSHPAEQRERQMSVSNDTRPRARTEDQDSHVMSQWRSNSPAVYPPMPRNGSTSSGSDVQTPHHAATQQIRKASSSRQLRQAAYASSGYPRPPLRGVGSADSASSDIDGTGEQLESLSMSGLRPRNDSTSSRGMSSSDAHLQHNRSRSASNPVAFAGATGVGTLPPPLPKVNYAGAYPNGMHPANDSQSQLQQPQGGAHPHAADRQGSGSNDKRFSSSSISTLDSNRSSHSRPGSTAASSPVTLSGGSSGFKGGQYTRSNQLLAHSIHQPSAQAAHQSNAVKLVIHHGDDRLVVVVLSNISFVDLSEKVNKKIRLISGKKGAPEMLRIRYIDEDGDRILMHDDEDVQMAFEMSRGLGTDVNLVVL